jgi:hypothetical protein
LWGMWHKLGGREMHAALWLGNLKKRYHLENLGEGGEVLN